MCSIEAQAQNDKPAKPRILVIKLSSFGDIFHAIPAVQQLKAQLGAEVDWVTQAEYAPLVRCVSGVSRVIPFHRRRALQTLLPFLRELRAHSYDYVFDLQGLLKSACIARLACAKTIIGPSFHRECAHWLYHAVAGVRNKDRHAVDENLDILRYLQKPVATPAFDIRFPDITLPGHAPRIGIIPVSRWESKNWPAASFIRTITGLTQRKASVFLLGGPADAEICRQIESACTGVINMAGKTSLVEMGSVLQKLDAVISNDSGPMHMAAAVGTPVVAVFGPTSPVRTGPFGPKHRILQTALPCQPCFSRTCRLRQSPPPCQTGITPEMVLQAVDELLVR
jgi:heptosyltransferase-1